MKRLASLLIFPLLVAGFLGGCSDSVQPEKGGGLPVKEIKIAYDPNKSGLFEELLSSYNASAPVKVKGVKLEIPDMLDAVPRGDLVAVSPDSAIWLESIDKAWQSAHSDATSVVGTTVRYATTPVVVATWQGREGELGAPGERGWASLLKRAKQDSSYRWSHGSPRASASGMLALIAEFYAGADKTFGLTKSDADREDVRRYVADIERTIARYGGQSDAELVEYLLKDAGGALSAIVMPEASVFDFNRRSRGAKLHAIQPVEGTLMLDHPLILLDTASLTPQQRRVFLDLTRFLTSENGQTIVAKHGYRPVSLSFDMQKSPLIGAGISTEQPRLLQMPAAGTTAYLRQSWASGLKRRANIVLVVDVSGSMEGEKLDRTQEALRAFVRQIPSDEERLALLTFSTDVQEAVPLGRLGDNRPQVLAAIDKLHASGSTSLFYAVWLAHRKLAQSLDNERINVVVAMTDGQENSSWSANGRVVQGIGRVPQLSTGNNSKDARLVLPAMQRNGDGVMVFTVRYGSDADPELLDTIARTFGGQSYGADPSTIAKLYELISQNF